MIRLRVAAAPLDLPIASLAPFLLLLLAIAVLPLAAPHRWESNRSKLFVALALGLPVGIWMAWRASDAGIPVGPGHPVFDALHDYVSFLLVLFALFAICGGIHVRGTLAGTPIVNTAILAIGTLLASIVGTTGASMLLIRPLLRANRVRKRKAHVVIFFIFLVANCGGLLTPLGDPPLFLGFLHGVPFLWTLQLWKAWAIVNGALLVAFVFLDSYFFHREDVEDRRDLDVEVERATTPLRIEGGVNLLLLAAVVATIAASGRQPWPAGTREAALLALALASIGLAPKGPRARNQFTYGPILEVAALFLGIFLTMIPALHLLNARAGELGIEGPAGFFWASGALSSFLDNAPTYMSFTAVAAGKLGIVASDRYLEPLLARPDGALLLRAISCGAVFMGANTYVGNGPNFMVKAIAESAGVRMPGFFGYVAWSALVLLPLFTLVAAFAL